MGTEPGIHCIWVVHGPNLNKLGEREPDVYGSTTLEDISADLIACGDRNGCEVRTFQSNSEGAIVDKLQAISAGCRGLVINPAAYTHTSVAIRDALLLFDTPIIEVHLSNIYKRESFRHKSMVADIATAQIAGFGVDGYRMALEALIRLTGSQG